MKYYSLGGKAPEVNFKEAVIRGIAPDRGLYFPTRIDKLAPDFFRQISNLSDREIAFQSMRQFVGDDIPEQDLAEIVSQVLEFEFPLVEVDENIAALELFHGPTMAFKDVGARFMARCLGHFAKELNEEVTVLVATSGDTGGAVAHGFLGVENVKVVILYPDGKVSDIQERQLTTLGQNISAIKVSGTFDDCQDMVKTAFLDSDITEKIRLTSANSINVARWLPQQFYYLSAYKRLRPQHDNIVFSVPSGNFGNICAGLVAQKQGMKVSQFVAATNVNDTVPSFMNSGRYEPKKSKATISNAMDVGDPSNFVRIRELFGGDLNRMREMLSAYSFTDSETREVMAQLYADSNYIADPHGAVGYLGLKQYLDKNPGAYGVFLETAHPVKFLDVVEATLNTKMDLPTQISQLMQLEKKAASIDNYGELKEILTSA